MDTPILALRFRDVVAETDSVSSHRSIIKSHGHAWWGWWKKSFEPARTAELQALSSPFCAILVDRSTQRMFNASVVSFVLGRIDESELVKVPSYYRQQERNVHGWFKVSSIEPTDYNEAIASLFGDFTLAFLTGNPPIARNPARIESRTKSTVLHLSDLHFGPDFDFPVQGTVPAIGDTKRTLTDCLVADLERQDLAKDIGLLLVTGDFITAGKWTDAVRSDLRHEFDALRDRLGLRKDQVLAVPGNHDIVRYGVDGPSAEELAVADQVTYRHEREYRTFIEELTGRSWQEPLNYSTTVCLKDADLVFAVLNSCTVVATEWTEYGYVGDKGISVLSELAAIETSRPTFKLVALHHHLLPVNRIAAPHSKGVTLSLDATEILDHAQRAGVHIVLHGHEHVPRLANYQTIPMNGDIGGHRLIIFSSGSTGAVESRRPPGERNTYCVFRFDTSRSRLVVRELRPDAKLGNTLFDGFLDIVPLTGNGP